MSRIDGGAGGEDAWREHVRAMLGRHRDPQVHEDVWDYLEGAIDRRQLMMRPAFRAAERAERESGLADLERTGGADALRASVGELRAGVDPERARRETVAELLDSLAGDQRERVERLLARAAPLPWRP